MKKLPKKIVLISLSVGIYTCFLAFLYFNRSYYCIDSSVVEKLDVITFNNGQPLGRPDVVYNCSVQKKSYQTEALNKYTEDIAKRLEVIATVLKQSQLELPSLQITVDETKPLVFKVQQRKLLIGSALLEASSHLERGIIKTWLDHNIKSSKFAVSLFNESLSDLIYFIIFGHLDIQDPLNHGVAKLNTAKWPQVLKNLDTYCESFWKSSEDYQSCADLNSENENLFIENETRRKQILTVSMRPLLTSGLIASYKQLGYKEKNQLFKVLPKILNRSNIDSEKAIDYLLNQSTPVKEGMSIIKIFSDLFDNEAESDLLEGHESALLRNFTFYFNQYLNKHGVADSFAEAHFDYLIEVPDKIVERSEFFKSLIDAKNMMTDLRVAVKSSDSIWLLPSKTALPLKIYESIQARQHLYFACSFLKKIDVSQFFNLSERLMLIKGCDLSAKYNFQTLFQSGVSSFARAESQLVFIQFYLPALQTQYNDLSHVRNFFDLVKHRDIAQPEFQKLGWQDIQWNSEFNYYKPKAYIDAIEFFRADAPNKSNTD